VAIAQATLCLLSLSRRGVAPQLGSESVAEDVVAENRAPRQSEPRPATPRRDGSRAVAATAADEGFFTIALLRQAGLGHTALQSGLVAMPFAIGSIVGASQSDTLAARFGRTVLVVGLGMVAVGITAVWMVLALCPPTQYNGWRCWARSWSPESAAGCSSHRIPRTSLRRWSAATQARPVAWLAR
jgi:hypothetical protein